MVALVVIGGALIAVWRFTPVHNFATPERVAQLFEESIGSHRDDPLLPLYVLGAFVVAGALFLSPWLLVFQTALLLPPPRSFFVALAGVLLSATTYFFIGRLLGERVLVRVLRPATLDRMRSAVQGAGIEGIIALRVLPVLPYTLVNVAAGALGVPTSTFLLGTAIGVLPATLAISFLGDRAMAVLRHPTPTDIGMLVVGAATLVGLAAGLRRLSRRRVEAGGAPRAPTTTDSTATAREEAPP